MKLTQNMTLHLNGGSEFSELHYEIHADGMPTGILRYTRTNGRPEYLKEVDTLHFGDETFDVLATKGEGLFDWVEQRAREALRRAETLL